MGTWVQCFVKYISFENLWELVSSVSKGSLDFEELWELGSSVSKGSLDFEELWELGSRKISGMRILYCFTVLSSSKAMSVTFSSV